MLNIKKKYVVADDNKKRAVFIDEDAKNYYESLRKE